MFVRGPGITCRSFILVWSSPPLFQECIFQGGELGRKRGIYWPSISFSFAGQICTPSILGPNIKKSWPLFSLAHTERQFRGNFRLVGRGKKFSFELDARNCFSAYIPALCKMRKKSEEGIFSFSFEYLLPHNVKKWQGTQRAKGVFSHSSVASQSELNPLIVIPRKNKESYIRCA